MVTSAGSQPENTSGLHTANPCVLRSNGTYKVILEMGGESHRTVCLKDVTTPRAFQLKFLPTEKVAVGSNYRVIPHFRLTYAE